MTKKISLVSGMIIAMLVIILWPTSANGLAEAQSTAVTPIPVAPGITFGLAGEIQCFNCAPMSAKVRLSHYVPNEGPLNCFDFEEKNSYCYSPTSSMIPWKSVWGFGAACPGEWKFGTWVNIPNVGAFICLDHGDSIVCDTETITVLAPDGGTQQRDDYICNVDILGPGGSWDKQLFDATLWVPMDPPRPE